MNINKLLSPHVMLFLGKNIKQENIHMCLMLSEWDNKQSHACSEEGLGERNQGRKIVRDIEVEEQGVGICACVEF